MPRSLTRGQTQKRATARREGALARNELRGPSEPRQSAAGPTSHAVKSVDPSTRDAIDRFLASKKVDNGKTEEV